VHTREHTRMHHHRLVVFDSREPLWPPTQAATAAVVATAVAVVDTTVVAVADTAAVAVAGTMTAVAVADMAVAVAVATDLWRRVMLSVRAGVVQCLVGPLNLAAPSPPARI
jgi:hypothetical protein